MSITQDEYEANTGAPEPEKEAPANTEGAPADNTVSQPNKKKKDDGSDGKLELYDWIQCVIAALVLGILFFVFVARVVNVEGSSMFPTLHDEDKVLTSGLFYKPQAGDVVVVQTDSYGPTALVKRVIATEGQTIDIDFDNGVVYVDDIALDEPYINAPTTTREDFEGPVTVPEGCVFLMGDNRNASTDSRRSTIGMVDERCIIGKVLMILIPSQTETEPRDWSRMGSIYNQ